MTEIRMIIGDEVFRARLEMALSPMACVLFRSPLPYEALVIHVQWSGEAIWIPTKACPGALDEENRLEQPRPGQVLWYGGGLSEPEVLIPYGIARFACQAGPLRGNHVLTLIDGSERLLKIGWAIL